MTSTSIWTSHASTDQGYCDQVVRTLQAEGYDIESFHYKGGSSAQDFVKEIKNRSVFLVILSVQALASEIVYRECKEAYDKYKLHNDFPCYIVYCESVDARLITGKWSILQRAAFTPIGSPERPAQSATVVQQIKHDFPQSQTIEMQAGAMPSILAGPQSAHIYPIYFLLDVSFSMNKSIPNVQDTPIQLLQQGFETMLDYLKNEAQVAQFSFLGMITFAHEVTYTDISDFAVPTLTVSTERGTCLGTALRCFRDAYLKWKAAYPSGYIPTLIIFTDGFPNDDWRVANQEMKHDITLFSSVGVACGPHADAQTLQAICEHVIRVATFSNDLFQDIFRFIALSIVQMTRSNAPSFDPNGYQFPPGISIDPSSNPT